MITGWVGELFRASARRFVEPLGEIGGLVGGRWFFAYLAFSLAVAFVLVVARSGDGDRSFLAKLRAAPGRVFDREVLTHPSARLDYRYAAINHIVTVVALVYLITAVASMTEVTNRAFGRLSFLEGAGLNLGALGAVVIVVLYAVAYDTAGFFQHMVQHKVPILWEFHKVHHSAEVLTPITVMRVHPLAQLISATWAGMVYGALNGLVLNLFAGDVARYTVIGINWFALLYFTFGLYHLKHTHLWVTFPRGIKEIFASPSLHLIHHSNNPRHYDKNYGFVFTFWDRVFGSYYDPAPEDQEDLTLGITDAEGAQDFTTVSGLYLTPLRRAWQHHLKPAPLPIPNSAPQRH